MNRRRFLNLLGGSAALAATNPVHFLAPAGGWRTTEGGLSFLRTELELVYARLVEPLTVGTGWVAVLTYGRVLLANGEELVVRQGDAPYVLPSSRPRLPGFRVPGYARVEPWDAAELWKLPKRRKA